ncbi:MAG TPA: hypothetical protein VGH33_23095 [Isosphaeraceae bacterium]
MRIPSDYAGRRVRCKICGAKTTVPIASPAASHSLGSASVLLDVPTEPAKPTDRRIELLPDERTDALVAEGTSSTLLGELGRPNSVPWYDLPRLARDATEAGISLTVAPRR